MQAPENKYKGFGSNAVVEDEKPLPSFPQHEIPMEEGGDFVQSFDISDTKNYLDFFQKYGFVVIRDVLSKQQVADTLEEVWGTEIEDESKKVNRRDPHTWTAKFGWPCFEQLGMLGDTCCTGVQAMSNRTNEKVYEAFQQIYGLVMPKEDSKKLWVSFDRYGIMRPTKNIPVPYDYFCAEKSEPKEVIAEKVEWKTASNWMHWDLNPWKLVDPEHKKLLNTKFVASEAAKLQLSRNPQAYFITENNDVVIDPLKLQGLVNLVDNRESDGGFLTVPAFSQYVDEWAKQTAGTIGHTKGNFVNVPKKDPMINQVRKVPLRAGSLLIWDGRQPHCNFPNDSERFRIVQYIKLFPCREADAELHKQRAQQVQEMLPAGFNPSELARKILSLTPY